jgi:hypothetical protein
VAQAESIEVSCDLAEAPPPSTRGSAAKDSAQGLPKACLRQALRRRFPPLCIWLLELVLSLVPRALCVLHGCIAVLSCMCQIGPCVRVALLRWGPGFRSEPRRATGCLQHDCEMQSSIYVRCCSWLQGMLVLHGSAWVPSAAVTRRVREAALWMTPCGPFIMSREKFPTGC